MLRTRRIVHGKGSGFFEYEQRITVGTRALRNTANFYIRNVMTAVRKKEPERTDNEKKVLSDVLSVIREVNAGREASALSALLEAKRTGGLRGSGLVRLALAARYFSDPSPERWLLSYELLDAVLKRTKNPDYYALPSQVNQQALRTVYRSWVSYLRALAAWEKDPSSFTGKPRIPGYIRTEGSTAKLTNQVCVLSEEGKDGFLSFPGFPGEKRPGSFNIGPPGGAKYVKTEIRPFHGAFLVLVTFDDGEEEPAVPEKPVRAVSIDQGVSNFLTVAANFPFAPVVIGGGYLKSLNRFFNKEKARLVSEAAKGGTEHVETKRLAALSRKREVRIRDIFYKTAHYVCREASAGGADVIVLGHSAGWKQGPKLGRKGNQNFVSIPFGAFARILSRVAAKYGIPVVTAEESYTSAASFLDGDPVPVYRKGEAPPPFSGKRVKRGLYRAKDGTLINADVNGAANILRKAFPGIPLPGAECLCGTVRKASLAGIVGKVEHPEPPRRKKSPSPTRAAARRARRRAKRAAATA